LEGLGKLINIIPLISSRTCNFFNFNFRKTVAEQSMSLQIWLGSVMEFARDLNRNFELALHCCKVALDKAAVC
jgi:hypothetical protein